MAELKARIKHKIGTPDEWSQATNFSPLKGELVVYNDATNPRMKIGDGETNVNDLPFINNAFVTVNLDGAGDGEDFVPDDNLVINAETLGGKPASSYMLKTDTATNSSKLGGKDPEYYLSPWLTGTTEEIAPMQVYQALMNQQNVMLTYPSTSFGPITFTKFSIMTNDPSTIVIANDFLLAKQFYLAGQIQSNEWHLYEESQFVTQNEYLSLDEHVEKNFYKKYDVYNKNEIDTLITNANVQGNWDQNDSSAEDYIQNRTHWKEEAEVEQTYSIYDNETVTINGYDDYSPTWGGMGADGYYYRGNYTEFENHFPADFHPKEGQRVYVTVSGYSFSGVLNSNLEIGDPHLASWAYTYEELLETPLTADYYCSFHEILNGDYNAIYLSLNPDLGIVGREQTLTITVIDTVNETVYHPLEEGYIPQRAFILPAYNLLDNSDFTNPVNQRGQASYTNSYGIDRWRTWDGHTITVNNGYVSVAGSMFQYIELSKVKNTNYTLAVCRTDGNIVCLTYNPKNAYMWNAGIGLGSDGTGVVIISIDTGDYLWAVLYEGEYTAENLPPYIPKGYAVELAECQRYYRKVINGIIKPYYSGTAERYYRVSLMPPMRLSAVPTITISGTDLERNAKDWSITNSTVNVSASDAHSITVRCVGDSNAQDFFLFFDADINSDL